MGLILDSSVVIAAERRGDTIERLIQRIVDATGDQEAALSAVGLTELVHGIFRAQTAEQRARREAFVEELLAALTVYPFTTEAARVADVTGAGDTVIATMALALAAGATLAEAARLANAAAGIAVAKFGPAVVTPAELLVALDASAST